MIPEESFINSLYKDPWNYDLIGNDSEADFSKHVRKILLQPSSLKEKARKIMILKSNIGPLYPQRDETVDDSPYRPPSPSISPPTTSRATILKDKLRLQAHGKNLNFIRNYGEYKNGFVCVCNNF